METRPYGKSGVNLSVVGFGGIALTDETPEDAARFVAEAVSRGVNYFDVAPTYGNAEERLGPALEPYRDDVFLACKTIKRKKDEAAAGLADSLKNLRTDHVDLYQFHGVTDMDEVDDITGPGGALEAVLEAKKDGRVRHVGFSAHSEEAAIAMMERFDFDSVLLPVNFACWHEGGFGQKAAAEAARRGVTLLALKALAKRNWGEGETRPWPKCWYAPVDTPGEAALALRWTLSQGVTAAVSPGHFELLSWMLDAAEQGLEPPTAEERAGLAETASGVDVIFRAPH